jgi:hypothetical protein
MVAIRIAHVPSQLVASLRQRTRRLVHRRALGRALRGAYGRFAGAHARWIASFFDDHFLIVHAMPLLIGAWESNRRLTPAQLAEAWRAQFSQTNMSADELCTQAIQIAATFLELLQAELDADRELALFHGALSR